MEDTQKKWFWIVVLAYFLGVVALFFLGLGKIATLMFSNESAQVIKTFFQVMAWISSAAGFLWGIKIYNETVKEKRYLSASDVLNELQMVLSDLKHLSKKRDQIVVMYSKFESRLRMVQDHEKVELEAELSSFCRGLLKRIEYKHIFGKVEVPVFANIDVPESLQLIDKKFEGELIRSAYYVFHAKLINVIGEKVFIKDPSGVVDLLTLIIKLSQPIIAQNYFKGREWKADKVEDLYFQLEKIPAAIINVYFSDKKQDIFYFCKKS